MSSLMKASKESNDQAIANMLKLGYTFLATGAGYSPISRISVQIKNNQTKVTSVKMEMQPKANSDIVNAIEEKNYWRSINRLHKIIK